MEKERILAVRDWAYRNLTECILPFWADEFLLDDENGGFVGRVSGDMEKDPKADRSLLNVGRIAFAMSESYRLTRDPLYLKRAERAFRYIVDHFYDEEFGLAFTTVDYKGVPLNTDKTLYCESFFIIACASYYGASEDPLALKLSLEAFRVIEERYKLGPAKYKESFCRDFSGPAKPLSSRPPVKEEGAVKFQLHLCHAYEILFKATGDPQVKEALRQYADYISDVLYDWEYHCFKNTVARDGSRIGMDQMIGHDAEISFLSVAIAEALGDDVLVEKTKTVVIDAFRMILERDIDRYGALIENYNLITGATDDVRAWWAEAMAAVSFMCAYQITGEERYFAAMERLLDYINRYFVDRKNGDWFNTIRVDEEGGHLVNAIYGLDKLNSIKDPFHNVQMCLELVKRCDRILKEGGSIGSPN